MGAATGRHGDQALNAIQQRIQKPTDTTAPHGHVLSVPFPHPLLSVVAVTGRIEAAQGRRRLDHRVDAERPGGVTTQSLVTSRGPTGLQPVFRCRRRVEPVPRGAGMVDGVWPQAIPLFITVSGRIHQPMASHTRNPVKVSIIGCHGGESAPLHDC